MVVLPLSIMDNDMIICKYITFSGVEFCPDDFSVDHVRIEDIAHSLSMMCRYNGHINEFYNVAEHCIRVSKRLEKLGFNKKIQLCGLLHDAAEAYLGDLVSPVKKVLYEYINLEKLYQDVIVRALKLQDEWINSYPIIKNADRDVLEEELKYFHNSSFGKEQVKSSKNINNYIHETKTCYTELFYRTVS